jgi:hypothetical protein
MEAAESVNTFGDIIQDFVRLHPERTVMRAFLGPLLDRMERLRSYFRSGIDREVAEFFLEPKSVKDMEQRMGSAPSVTERAKAFREKGEFLDEGRRSPTDIRSKKFGGFAPRSTKRVLQNVEALGAGNMEQAIQERTRGTQ